MDIKEIVKQAVELDASDIFIVAGASIAFKVKNEVKRFNSEILMPEQCRMMVDDLYHLANNRSMEKLDKKGDDDFSFSLSNLARLRVNVYHQRGSLAAVIRLVQFDIPTAEEMGIPKEITRFSELTKGLVIISGPAGAGKSSTLAILLDLINRHKSGHIVTIEDPIEFLHKHDKSIVSQREIGTDCDDSASALKSALRQAPNV